MHNAFESLTVTRAKDGSARAQRTGRPRTGRPKREGRVGQGAKDGWARAQRKIDCLDQAASRAWQSGTPPGARQISVMALTLTGSQHPRSSGTDAAQTRKSRRGPSQPGVTSERS